MRKWIVLLLIVLVLSLVLVYFIIPNNISLEQKTRFAINEQAFSRGLFNETTWQYWWPEKENNMQAPRRFSYNGNDYRILEKKFSSLLLSIKKGKDSVLTELLLIPGNNDSTEINWLGNIKTGMAPTTRISKNSWAKELVTDMQILLRRMGSCYSKAKPVYGFHIQETLVVDTALILTSAVLKDYPTTETVYRMIDKLKTFAQTHQAKQTGAPMLNITANADNTYLTRVAMPVGKKLSDEGDVQYRWMLGGGNILVAEIKGGPFQIESAFAAMDLYVSDHHRVAPAIPFQSLITDRRVEPDTAKWITKLYWPVM